MVTVYEKDSGKAVIFAHAIDAKESLATGFYVSDNPKKAQSAQTIPALEKPAPTVIPEPIVKKPAPIKTSKKITRKPTKIMK